MKNQNLLKLSVLSIIIVVLSSACLNKSDTKHRFVREYYSNGNVKRKVPTKNGLQDGILQEFYETGEIYITQGWKMGEQLGNYYVYDKAGKILLHEKHDYWEDSGKQHKGLYKFYKDSTCTHHSNPRIVIEDSARFKSSVILIPELKTLKGGKETVFMYHIPNVEHPTFKVKNATFYSNGSHAFRITPKEVNQKVCLQISAEINDTTIEFDPVFYEVK